ncbi:hypothetical protein AB0D56_38395 [Streptomyces sp. NPDC048209]|uniref:hypothetical protein n=1 Tax=Streptomyces sp. NPDC048209 TaxID=3156689 RepID=UPI0034171B55
MLKRNVGPAQAPGRAWQRFVRGCSVIMSVGGLTAACLTVPAAANEATTRVTPGYSTARLVIGEGSVTWGGNTVGWSTGPLNLHVRLYWNDDLQDDRDQTCYGSTSCSADSMTRNWLCPGRWTVRAWAEGPGGTSNVDVKEAVVGDGGSPTGVHRTVCAQPI